MADRRKFVAWRDHIVHESIFKRSSQLQEYEEGRCEQAYNGGDWYQAPAGSSVTCLGCIAVADA